MVVGPVRENSAFEARPIAYKGKEVATLDKYERTRNRASQSSMLRVDGGAYSVWTVAFPGERHEREFNSRNDALVAIVQRTDDNDRNQASTG